MTRAVMVALIFTPTRSACGQRARSSGAASRTARFGWSRRNLARDHATMARFALTTSRPSLSCAATVLAMCQRPGLAPRRHRRRRLDRGRGERVGLAIKPIERSRAGEILEEARGDRRGSGRALRRQALRRATARAGRPRRRAGRESARLIDELVAELRPSSEVRLTMRERGRRAWNVDPVAGLRDVRRCERGLEVERRAAGRCLRSGLAVGEDAARVHPRAIACSWSPPTRQIFVAADVRWPH